ncbi:DUF1015 family protein [bacterium]|nr:DUF1015 family protein [bacterium]
MTTIIPFAALRYNPDRIAQFADVIAPPYDKISHAERKNLWERHENNVARLILPPPGDKETDVMTQSMDEEDADWYHRSAHTIQSWKSNQILTQDAPQLYTYKQTYNYKQNSYTRSGLFCALRLDKGSGPHAHEFTFDGPKADRLRLLKATSINLSPIFLLSDGGYDEWEQIFQLGQKPVMDFVDPKGQEHALHAMADSTSIARAQEYLKNRTLVIADGHHRYETAVNYCKYMEEKTGLDSSQYGWGYVFALIVPITNPGLLVLPTHRVLNNLSEEQLSAFQEKAAPCFDIDPLPDCTGETVKQALNQSQQENAIVFCSKNDSYLLTLKPETTLPALNDIPKQTRDLNVSILHHWIFPEGLNLSQDHLQENTRYIRGEEEAIQMVRENEFDAAFLMKAISAERVFDISQTGERMPQKSTDFYPKIPTGLLMRPVDEKVTSV